MSAFATGLSSIGAPPLVLEGFTTVILLLLLIGGGILIGLGIIGGYVAAIYHEVKGRPRYIIRQDTEKQEHNG